MLNCDKNRKYVGSESPECFTKSIAYAWNMHYKGDIVNSSSSFFVNNFRCLYTLCGLYLLHFCIPQKSKSNDRLFANHCNQEIKNTLVICYQNVSLNLWHKHKICIIMVIFLTVFHYTSWIMFAVCTRYCDVFQLFGNTVYSGKISCVYHTHIVLLNKNLPVYDQLDSLSWLQGKLYAVRWIRLEFVIWYLISLMNFNIRALLRWLNWSFVCLFVSDPNS